MNNFYMKAGDDDNVYYVSGKVEALSPRHYTVEFGKYKGFTLAEIDDLGYLKWLHKVSVEKNDWFLERVVKIRLNEMS